MDFELPFVFRDKTWTCTACIDATEQPVYVFIQLKDSLLIQEFGDEVTLKTDFETRLPKKDDLGELPHLRQSIFEALKDHPRFRGAWRQGQFASPQMLKKGYLQQ